MLKWDKVETINGLSVYGDEADPNLWYALPQTPRFRIDNGKPVFKFIKYKFPIEHAGGKKGGGFLICDVEFGVSRSEEDALLEVLQDQVIQRVGGEAEVPVDVLVIAATNADLGKMVADGTHKPTKKRKKK